MSKTEKLTEYQKLFQRRAELIGDGYTFFQVQRPFKKAVRENKEKLEEIVKSIISEQV